MVPTTGWVDDVSTGLASDPYETRNLAEDSAFTAPLRAELNRLATKFDYPLPPEATVPAKP